MSVTPQDFLDSAKRCDLTGGEVVRRNAVSRAYYAAMHEARTLLPPSNERQVFRGSSHEKLIASLRAHYRKLVAGRGDGAMIAGELSALKGDRTKAAYKLDSSVDEGFAKYSLRRADKIFDASRRIKALSTRVE